jgi:hypothetical protein
MFGKHAEGVSLHSGVLAVQKELNEPWQAKCIAISLFQCLNTSRKRLERAELLVHAGSDIWSFQCSHTCFKRVKKVIQLVHVGSDTRKNHRDIGDPHDTIPERTFGRLRLCVNVASTINITQRRRRGNNTHLSAVMSERRSRDTLGIKGSTSIFGNLRRRNSDTRGIKQFTVICGSSNTWSEKPQDFMRASLAH